THDSSSSCTRRNACSHGGVLQYADANRTRTGGRAGSADPCASRTAVDGLHRARTRSDGKPGRTPGPEQRGTKYRSVIEVQGDYLSRNPNLHVRVEGNTDERGSSEYNLALGQRRAEAVTGALKLYGVKDSQVEAVSFGREKPKAAGHDEAAWAENRRADVVYPGAK
ncbi:MAG: hypothetical protein E6H58_15190, partial [Betaproteobacteria bacterium]